MKRNKFIIIIIIIDDFVLQKARKSNVLAVRKQLRET